MRLPGETAPGTMAEASLAVACLEADQKNHDDLAELCCSSSEIMLKKSENNSPHAFLLWLIHFLRWDSHTLALIVCEVEGIPEDSLDRFRCFAFTFIKRFILFHP